MGYVVWQLGSRFKLRREFHKPALAKVKSLHWGVPPGLLGLSQRPQIRNVGNAYGPMVVTAETLADALQEWRWLVTFEDDLNQEMPPEDPVGDVVDLKYVGEKMSVQDNDLLFEAIAEFVDDGSYIAMTGEDKRIWRWYFTQRRCIRQPGHLAFDAVP